MNKILLGGWYSSGIWMIFLFDVEAGKVVAAVAATPPPAVAASAAFRAASLIAKAFFRSGFSRRERSTIMSHIFFVNSDRCALAVALGESFWIYMISLTFFQYSFGFMRFKLVRRLPLDYAIGWGSCKCNFL